MLRLVDPETVEAVEPDMGQQVEGTGAFKRQVDHVVREVEEDGSGLPGLLLVPPVGELGWHAGIYVRPQLDVEQPFDDVPGGGEKLLQTPCHIAPPDSRAGPSLGIRSMPDVARMATSPT